jgi:hypothetical protein
MNQSKFFLEALVAGKADSLYLLLWMLPEKESRWFRKVEDAIHCAETFHNHDLYVGLGLAGQDYGPKRRCLSEEVAGIVSLGADLDLRSDAHPKPTLPETPKQALSILPPDFPPTFVISTGNGLQAWWLFREPYLFESDDERRAAAILTNRWHTLLRDNASRHGWTYDRLSDLARVLRVPGTTNCKNPSSPKPVVIESQSGRRYNPSELEEYLDDLAVPDLEGEAGAAREWAQRFHGKPATINLSARIAEDQINRWLETDLRFKNTWFRQRHDLRDQSQSAYDLALACFAFGAGCSEQEVIDLIVHHRTLHKQKPRTRLDYFQRTLAKACSLRADRSNDLSALPGVLSIHDSSGKSGWHDNKEPVIDQPPSSDAVDRERAKIGLCRQISSALGVEVLRLVKLTGKEPLYRMELAEGKIEFDNVAKFISQTSVRCAIAAIAGKLIVRFKAKDWERLAQMLLSACIEEQGGEELQYEGAARMHIAQYLAETGFIASIEDQLPQNLRKPMVREGRITVCASDLQMYINKMTMQNLGVRSVAAMLSAIGATTIRIRGRKIREQGRWELPIESFPPDDCSVPEPQEGGGSHE